MNETPISRRRHATYGKAVRKRPPEHVATRKPFSTHSIFDDEHIDVDQNKSIDTSGNGGKIYNKSITKSPASPASAIFDVPSSTDSTPKPHKKRKLLRPTRHPVPSDAFKFFSPEALPESVGKSNGPNILAGKQLIDARSRNDEGKKTMQANTMIMPRVSKNEQTNLLPAVIVAAPSIESAKPQPDRRTLDAGVPTQDTRNKRAKLSDTEMLANSPQNTSLKTGIKSINPPVSHLSSSHTQVAKTPLRKLAQKETPSPQPSAEFMTPKGLEMWNELLSDVADSVSQDQFISVSDSRGSSPLTKNRPPRKRLIDSLMEQSSDPLVSRVLLSDSEEEDDAMPVIAESLHMSPTESERLQSHHTPIPHIQNTSQKASTNALKKANQAVQISNAKITYSHQRSILVEKDISEELAISVPLRNSNISKQSQRRGSVTNFELRNRLQDPDDIDEAHTNGSIRTVHELRQAGANNRFADEVEDLLDRIGRPGHQLSMRRSALLELAEKMNEKYFLEKFIANGMDQRLFLNLGQETDIVCGYLIVSMLLTMLNHGVTSAIVTHIHRQDIATLLLRLVKVEEHLTTLSKKRKSNISKMTQAMLTEYSAVILRLGIWDDMKPSVVSPSTLALRVLEFVIRQSPAVEVSTNFSTDELVAKLFDIICIPSEHSGMWEKPYNSHTVDSYYALSILELQSSKAVAVSKESSWAKRYFPIIRDVLERMLMQTSSDSGIFQALAVRLTLNITNNNPEATEVFATPQLILAMSNAIVVRFQSLYGFLVEDERSAVVDHLVLMLGVMINFAEWSLEARNCFEMLQINDVNPLGVLAEVFRENLDRAFEADSFEDSHRNVAFGYLSVLLGYLCLNPAIHSRLKDRLGKDALQPLIGSIEEFISHHKKVDDLLESESDVQRSEFGLTERLQDMVQKLRSIGR